MIPTQANIVAAHQTRYRDAMLRAWMRRTGQGSSYHPSEVPPYITVPTNEQRSACEVTEFYTKPLPYGASYVAYLSRGAIPGSSQLAITTWTGDILATVTQRKTRRVYGAVTDERGSFWALGIDGRWYYGRDNGVGMYCRMRLSKEQRR